MDFSSILMLWAQTGAGLFACARALWFVEMADRKGEGLPVAYGTTVMCQLTQFHQMFSVVPSG